MKVIDMVGNRFGKLTVIGRADNTKCRKARWLCRCDCGKEVIREGYKLRSGQRTNCGCEAWLCKRQYNKYECREDYMVGYDAKGNEFIFDVDDYELIVSYCWHVEEKGYVVSNKSRKDKGNRRLISLHRLLLGDGDYITDHINRNPSDNRRRNLRKVTSSQNCMNSSINKRNTSGATGVDYNREKRKWQARIQNNKKTVFLGWFENKENAIAARHEAEKIYYGEYNPIERRDNYEPPPLVEAACTST